MDLDQTVKAYPFHRANIHERRWAAVACRSFPLGFLVLVVLLALHGTFKHQKLLLIITATFNLMLWLWVVSTAMLSIYACLWKLPKLDHAPVMSKAVPSMPPAACGEENANDETSVITVSTSDKAQGNVVNNGVRHLIVLPNYKEDDELLRETLACFAECEGSSEFWVVLAMEAREGLDGKKKAEKLKSCFCAKFARIIFSSHPKDLTEKHLDGTEDEEVPGKASNLKYAVDLGYIECESAGFNLDRVLLTVADADCLFHPLYFSHVARDFRRNESLWTMWQPPQLSYRNFYTAPIVSRAWAYVAATYEFGGLSSTLNAAFGNHHMTFSSFTMPLQLAYKAEAWDGDVITDDHHAFLKCFYYALQNRERVPGEAEGVSVRPVFLPVKSTMVASEGFFQSWIDRWFQAKRHAQGVAEISYALLATWDALWTQPWRRMMDLRLLASLVQIIIRIFCMHILPICQTICIALLTAKWFLHHRHIEMCPDRLWLWDPSFFSSAHNERYILCGMAGAWVLTWPVMIPWILLVLSNFLLIRQCFLKPAASNRGASIWHGEDAKVPNCSSWRVLGLIFLDTIFGMSWILLPYGFLVELIAFVNVAIFGNRFKFVTANKGVCCKRKKNLSNKSTYGSLEAGIADNAGKPKHALAELQGKLVESRA